jgi:hypothetical protein
MSDYSLRINQSLSQSQRGDERSTQQDDQCYSLHVSSPDFSYTFERWVIIDTIEHRARLAGISKCPTRFVPYRVSSSEKEVVVNPVFITSR